MTDVLDDHLMEPKPEPTGVFEFFRDFFHEAQALDLIKLLDAQAIPYKYEPVKPILDSNFMGNGLVPHSVLKLRPADFTKANQLLAEKALADEDFVANHYFQEYKAAELLEVVQKPDEWTAEDAALARHLLDKQGIGIPAEKVEAITAQRRQIYQEGQPLKLGTLVFYIVVVLMASVLINQWFWIGGIGLGWYYWMDKTTYFDGQSYFTFDATGRKAGMAIFFLSCFALALSLFYPLNISNLLQQI